MKRKSMMIRGLLILLLPLALLLNYFAALYPMFTERYYSNGLYRMISWVVSRLTGWLPFSLAEFMLLVLCLLIVWRMGVFAARMIRRSNRGKRWGILIHSVFNLLVCVSILYFSFILLWGLNYNRLTLSQILELEVKPASGTELRGLTEHLITEANALRGSVPENPEGVMIPINGVDGALDRAKYGFLEAVVTYPQLDGAYSRPKPVTFSQLMAYTNIWGIYSPFTVEANVNTAIPLSLLPATIAHEMAHQRGFAREDEANYIAYLVCRMHPDDDFRYSGTLFALTYAMDALAQHNRPAHQELRETLHEGVLRDLADIRRFHQRFESPAREVFTKTNDIYLKANSQEDGERSYGRMVDLMMAEFRLMMLE